MAAIEQAEIEQGPSVNPLVALIVSQPGMADRLLAEHADDGVGRCRVCSAGPQAGRQTWPCSIHRRATEASEVERGRAGARQGSGPSDA